MATEATFFMGIRYAQGQGKARHNGGDLLKPSASDASARRCTFHFPDNEICVGRMRVKALVGLIIRASGPKSIPIIHPDFCPGETRTAGILPISLGWLAQPPHPTPPLAALRRPDSRTPDVQRAICRADDSSESRGWK
jgi:hypothetical protein